MLYIIWSSQHNGTIKLAKYDTRRNRKDIEHMKILKHWRFISRTKGFLKYKTDTDGFTGQYTQTSINTSEHIKFFPSI